MISLPSKLRQFEAFMCDSANSMFMHLYFYLPPELTILKISLNLVSKTLF